ncbi:hypothetical protein [Bacillus sp. B15-48]|uniref:hypothetical protein n=1 Tax=Bacillus sp. B15-48 TaxID=1548601 RepID=UPI00193F9A85|nr:hypothetical protein [Bacillus sp. B15-48]MBM4760994.1 hypothetical protein [Bacillus sp. B15-48]
MSEVEDSNEAVKKQVQSFFKANCCDVILQLYLLTNVENYALKMMGIDRGQSPPIH